MKHVSILIPDGNIIQNTVISVIGAYKMFSVVNEFYDKMGKKTVFDISLVGNSKQANLYDGMFSIRPDVSFSEVKKTDLIIVPPAELSQNTINSNKLLMSWLVEQYRDGAEVASLCIGAFLLASTGLLTGKDCSTHWAAADEFRKQFPKVHLVPDKVITEQDGIYTNGGAYSFLNLLLHIVEKNCGREVAIYCAKVGEIDIDRNCQSPFMIFLPQKNHNDEMIKKAQGYIENNVTKDISVESLAEKNNLSIRNFGRRFKRATGDTPADYIIRARIEYAKKNLEIGRKKVNEVMYEIGYSDARAFRSAFKKITGLLPLEYRKKYNKAASTDVQ